MKFPRFHSASFCVEQLRHRWRMLAPPQRLVILSLTMGALFTLCLTLLLSERGSDMSPANSPTDIGLVADRVFLAQTPIQLIYFSFHKIPDALISTCQKPVTLADAEWAQNKMLLKNISKGAFLCWTDIDPDASAEPITIKRGYRVMGFQVSNPEILFHIQKGKVVDAILDQRARSPVNFEHVRVVDLIFQDNQPFILLEVHRNQLDQHQITASTNATVKIVLRNQDEAQPEKPPIKKMGPIIHSG